MTIKGGLNSLTSLTQEVRSKHVEVKQKDKRLYQGLVWVEEAHKETRVRRDSFDAIAITNIVLESQRMRRSRSEPRDGLEKKHLKLSSGEVVRAERRS